MPLPGAVSAATKKASLLLGAVNGPSAMGGAGAAGQTISSSSADKEYRTDRSFAETFQQLMDLKY